MLSTGCSGGYVANSPTVLPPESTGFPLQEIMPIKVAIKTTLNALSNESAAFPRLRCTLHVRPKPLTVRSAALAHFYPSPTSPPALPEPQTGAALPVSGSKTSREQFGARKSEPFASLPPVQPGVSQGREPWKKPQKISRRNVGACLGRYECAKELWGLCRGLASLQLGTNAVI